MPGKARHIVRERVVPARPDTVWPFVARIDRLADWFAFADRVELLGGREVGRRQRLHVRWGRKRSEVDQMVTAYEAPRLIEWRHEGERLDGRPAPQYAAETVLAIRLSPEDDGTRVTLDSRQVPASGWRGLAMRLVGDHQVAQGLEDSLEALAKLVSGDDRTRAGPT